MIGYQLVSILMWLMRLYGYLLIARILMTWVPDIERTQIGRLLARITDPYLGIFRRFIPPLSLGGSYLDFSPIVAYLCWQFVESGVAIVLNWVLTR